MRVAVPAPVRGTRRLGPKAATTPVATNMAAASMPTTPPPAITSAATPATTPAATRPTLWRRPPGFGFCRYQPRRLVSS